MVREPGLGAPIAGPLLRGDAPGRGHHELAMGICLGRRGRGRAARENPGRWAIHREASGEGIRPAAHRFGSVWGDGPFVPPVGFVGLGFGSGFGCPPLAMMRLPPFEMDLPPGQSTLDYARLD